MKNILSKIILAIGLSISVVSCGWFTKMPKDNTDTNLGTSMMNSYVMDATMWQVDSICKADALPDMDVWLISTFKDFETGEAIVRRMYIKQLGEEEIIYIITGDNEPYKVTRRITK